MELKGSKTEANLWTAFAGESQARNKYDYFASKAKKEGYEQIAAIFQETALNEKEHAKLWFKALNGIGTTAENLVAAVERLTGRAVIDSIPAAEPIGPKALLDVLVIAPCTGNTLARLAGGVTDTAVTMAAKAHLRNGRPVVIAMATNDGLSAAARNIGELLARKNYYFVPFGQDDPEKKPCSLMADFSRIGETIDAALEGRQLQPILL